MRNSIICGDCLEVMRGMKDNSIDAIVTDPPYGLSFMGKKWDYDVPGVDVWKECLRVLKPGGYLLAFAGTRTQHRMAVNIEDAGFEVRDIIMWVYGSGFPKSLNIGKSIDVVKKGILEWEGWGTALKPSCEPITMCRKPLEKGLTVAQNCLKWGTGGINIDGCRIGFESTRRPTGTKILDPDRGWNQNSLKNIIGGSDCGRWPANLIHDGSEEVMGIFPDTKSGGHFLKNGNDCGKGIAYGKFNGLDQEERNFPNEGSAARFFYCAKAAGSERNDGCDGSRNNHPTVKPIKLMEYLVRMVSRKDGVVLDPFVGSGTTAIACINERRIYIGIERESEYCKIAEARIEKAKEDFVKEWEKRKEEMRREAANGVQGELEL